MSGKATKVQFPEVLYQSGATVEHCIQQRRSVRDFRRRALTEPEFGQLLWAAQGVTADDGGRAAPSAGALYPLEVYAVCGDVGALAGGVYHYCSGRHELRLTVTGDQREKLAGAALGQEWIASAPAVICIAAVFERTIAKYGDRGRGYVYMEAGHAAENFMLQAVALGLATTMVGAFSDSAVKHVLQLASGETPLCLLPVGVP
jgi:SagB-type dehydrogenase family enzyme